MAAACKLPVFAGAQALGNAGNLGSAMAEPRPVALSRFGAGRRSGRPGASHYHGGPPKGGYSRLGGVRGVTRGGKRVGSPMGFPPVLKGKGHPVGASSCKSTGLGCRVRWGRGGGLRSW